MGLNPSSFGRRISGRRFSHQSCRDRSVRLSFSHQTTESTLWLIHGIGSSLTQSMIRTEAFDPKICQACVASGQNLLGSGAQPRKWKITVDRPMVGFCDWLLVYEPLFPEEFHKSEVSSRFPARQTRPCALCADSERSRKAVWLKSSIDSRWLSESWLHGISHPVRGGACLDFSAVSIVQTEGCWGNDTVEESIYSRRFGRDRSGFHQLRAVGELDKWLGAASPSPGHE